MKIITVNEENELNKELVKLQNKAQRLISSEYYDHVKLSEIEYSVLNKLTNAKTHKDINWYLWNSGLLQQTLDRIERTIIKLKG